MSDRNQVTTSIVNSLFGATSITPEVNERVKGIKEQVTNLAPNIGLANLLIVKNIINGDEYEAHKQLAARTIYQLVKQQTVDAMEEVVKNPEDNILNERYVKILAAVIDELDKLILELTPATTDSKQ